MRLLVNLTSLVRKRERGRKKSASVNSAIGTTEPASMKLPAKKIDRLRQGWRLQQQHGVEHAAGIRQRRFSSAFTAKQGG